MVMGSFGKRLMVRMGPFKATGDITAFTRLPSGSLASAMGILSFTTRLQRPTIC